jgi:hypothetical protein
MTAASIGQVHRAAWHDVRQVAVKIQYPGAGRALISDFNQLSRFARLFSALMPGLDAKPLIAELRDRAAEGPDPRRRRAGGAEKVHAVGQSGAARQDGSVSVASWARTDNMVGRAVEGRHG